MIKNLIKIFYLPPPNITGKLHIGHALNFIITDIIIKNNNINGFKTLWIPGLDHAGIATQNIIEKFLYKYGFKKKKKIFFYKKWKKKYINIIIKQIKKLNLSLNWKLKYFTLNKKFSKLIKKIFIRLYKKNLIINKKSLINWDICLKSTISDIEIKNYFKLKFKINIIYPLSNKKGYFIINEIFNNSLFNKILIIKKNIFFKKKIFNFNNNNKIPILIYNIRNKFKKKETFTFNIKHKLKINIDKCNFLKKIYFFKKHKIINFKKKFLIINKSDKTNSLIKYKFKKQWFLLVNKNTKNLNKIYFSFKKNTFKVIKNNFIKIVPKKWKKNFLNWIKKIKNWCISRQLWIGHKIPIFYIKNKIIIINNFKKKYILNKYKKNIIKEKNVLDTWFSSSLLPIISKFLIKKIFNFKKFLKTEILITGYDIIFFWVIRMIMFSLFFLKKIPFKTIYIHGLIVDEKGKKMSKSIGNIINPDILIKKYNSDIFRFGIISLNNKKKNIVFHEKILNNYKIFYNKLININNFIINKSNLYKNFIYLEKINKNIRNLSIIEKWIISIIEENKIIIQNNIKNLNIYNNIKIIYKLIKNLYSNIYIELIKFNYNNKCINIKYNICKNILYSFIEIIKLIYPIIPNLSKKLLKNLQFLFKIYKINLNIENLFINLDLNLINLNIKIFFIKYIFFFNKYKNKNIKYLIIYSKNFKILNMKNILLKKIILINKIYIKNYIF